MTSETIKQLLEKYWACETSQEEERALKSFFSGNNIPEELRKYKALFLWKTEQLEVKGSRKLETGMKKPVSAQFYSLLTIAASVLLVFTLGIGFYTHYQQEKYMEKVFSETYSDPEEALKETKIVIEKVSSVLNLAKDKRNELQRIDSLERITTSKPLNNE